MKTSAMRVTPELAKAWLDQNDTTNRVLRPLLVARYANAMRNGEWCLTHQGICFNSHGHLVDGQHRLAAVVKSGVTVTMLVTEGAGYGFAAPLDVGANRHFADILGVPRPVVAAARVLAQLEVGTITRLSLISLGQVEDVSKRPDLLRLAELSNLGSGKRWAGVPCSTRVVAGLAFARPCGPEKIDRLMRSIVTGEMIEAGDPAYLVRSKLGSKEYSSSGNNGLIPAKLALQAALAEIQNRKLTRTKTGATQGYVTICQHRRAMNIPNTPLYIDSDEE